MQPEPKALEYWVIRVYGETQVAQRSDRVGWWLVGCMEPYVFDDVIVIRKVDIDAA